MPNVPTYLINRILTVLPGFAVWGLFNLTNHLMDGPGYLMYVGAALGAATAGAVAAAHGESMVQWDRELTRWITAQGHPEPHPDGVHAFLRDVTGYHARMGWYDRLIMLLEDLRAAEDQRDRYRYGHAPTDQRTPAHITPHGPETLRPDNGWPDTLTQMTAHPEASKVPGVTIRDPDGVLQLPPAAHPHTPTRSGSR